MKPLADLQGKHDYPLASVDIDHEARDICSHALADALGVSGKGAGEEADLRVGRRSREVIPDRPILVGSGARPDGVADLLAVADGAIMGAGLTREGDIANPMDPSASAAWRRRPLASRVADDPHGAGWPAATPDIWVAPLPRVG